VCADGRIHKAFDEAAALRVIERLKAEKIEAVAVSFLWSIVNAAHELQMQRARSSSSSGALYARPSDQSDRARVPADVVLRIDASLKPVMTIICARCVRIWRRAGTARADSCGHIARRIDRPQRVGGSANSGAELRPVDGAGCRPALCEA